METILARNSFTTITSYISEIKDILEMLPWAQVAKVAEAIREVRERRGRVYIFGNGGSAATALHFASDLSKSANIKASSLVGNAPLLSAWANDNTYANVFAGQLENVIELGDIAIGISCSGQSLNVKNGITIAKGKGAIAIGLTGLNGEKLRDLVDICIVVPSKNTRQIEDIHLVIGHIITTCLSTEEME